MTEESALQHLKAGLLSEDMGFIYHCLNHYFCPVGYEDQPHVSYKPDKCLIKQLTHEIFTKTNFVFDRKAVRHIILERQ